MKYFINLSNTSFIKLPNINKTSLIFSFLLLLNPFVIPNSYAAETAPTPAPASNAHKKVTTKLIDRGLFFKDPTRAGVQISPDGKWISYLAPHKGVLNIWVADPKNLKNAKPITDNSTRGIKGYIWAYTNQHIIYVDDEQGNENWRIFRVDVKTGNKLTLASYNKVQARLMARSQNHPNEILIGLNQRRSDLHDVYRLNIIDGKQQLVMQNDAYTNIVTDTNLNIRLGIKFLEEGGATAYKLHQNSTKGYDSKLLYQIPAEDMLTYSPLHINQAGDTLYTVDSRGRDTAALVALNLNSEKSEVLAEDAKVDIDNILVHPKTKTIQAYALDYERPEWFTLDKSLDSHMKYLKQLSEGDLIIISRSLEDNAWIVAYDKDDGAPNYYYYDKPNQKAYYLFSTRPELDKIQLTKMDPVVITSRDNLPLVSYLSLPLEVRTGPAKSKQPVPLVLIVHGGPDIRDAWGYDAEHQWLANRGYAVLAVNYRGSTGFGKKFVNAGNGEWGNKMHDDLIDAVNWAIDQGITTRDRVAIMGGSYGGYATLIGLTKTPETFACGVDIVGPSNLQTLLKSMPDYWKSAYALMKMKVGGDPDTEKGRDFLASRSPLTFVENIKRPLLIAQGANDPRVKQAEADQIVKAMENKKIPVTYVLYPDEGHGFSRPENRLSFYAVTEAFLAKHLGGKFQPIQNDFKNSSIKIETGKDGILTKN